MNALNLINILTLLNQLLGLLKQEGIGWADLKARIDKAHTEGREFGLEDLVLLQAKDDEERAKLDAAIEARRKVV